MPTQNECENCGASNLILDESEKSLRCPYCETVVPILQKESHNTKPCRFCDKDISARAIKCRYCRRMQIALPRREMPYSGDPKSPIVAGLLALFLGTFGVHKFYLGYVGEGLVYLLTNTVGLLLTCYFLWVPNFILLGIAFLEGIIYLTKSSDDFQETYVANKRGWF